AGRPATAGLTDAATTTPTAAATHAVRRPSRRPIRRRRDRPGPASAVLTDIVSPRGPHSVGVAGRRPSLTTARALVHGLRHGFPISRPAVPRRPPAAPVG